MLSREELKGITWDYNPREAFGGIKVTYENQKQLAAEFFKNYIQANSEDGLYDEELEKKAYLATDNFIKREKKHYEAYNKGKQWFSWKGERLPVLYVSRVERFKKLAEEFEKRQEEILDKIEG